jgi:hypothetical protein
MGQAGSVPTTSGPGNGDVILIDTLVFLKTIKKQALWLLLKSALDLCLAVIVIYLQFIDLFRLQSVLPLVLSGLIGCLALAVLVRLAHMNWRIFLLYKEHSRRLILPPGFRLRLLIDFFYSKQTRERIFDPVIADNQSEWLEAVSCNETWKARWIRLHCYLEVAENIGLHGIVSTIKKIISSVKLS